MIAAFAAAVAAAGTGNRPNPRPFRGPAQLPGPHQRLPRRFPRGRPIVHPCQIVRRNPGQTLRIRPSPQFPPPPREPRRPRPIGDWCLGRDQPVSGSTATSPDCSSWVGRSTSDGTASSSGDTGSSRRELEFGRLIHRRLGAARLWRRGSLRWRRRVEFQWSTGGVLGLLIAAFPRSPARVPAQVPAQEPGRHSRIRLPRTSLPFGSRLRR